MIAISCLILGVFAVIWQIAPGFFTGPTSGPTTISGNALIGGDYTLTDHNGKRIQSSDFHGKYQLVYFGFTYCPDICPTSLMIMGNSLNDIGTKLDDITPIFITVDPERDTVDILAQYVSNFHDKLIGLTGTLDEVDVAAKAYKVYYGKVEQEGSAADYLVDHSGFMYLMDREGKYLAHFPHNVSEQELTAALIKHIQ